MACTESVIDTFVPFRESAQAILHPVTEKCLPTSREDLVRISLMSYNEHDLVLWSIVHIMQSHNEFHGTETGAEVTGIDRATLYYILPDFRTQLLQ